MNNTNTHSTKQAPNPILVIGGTGKTGRRVALRLQAKGIAVRIGSRNATPSFDWENPATWAESLQNVKAVYITYYPDLAVPEAPEAIHAFCQLAVKSGVEHLVLLSGRGEDEAQHCEEIVKNAGVAWTILRSSWFSQNFSEGFIRDFVVAGHIALPVGAVREPFVDADDIADVAVAALTESGHADQLYELTGPRLLSFTDAANEIAKATGQPLQYTQIPQQAFISALTEQNVPEEAVGLLDYLFTTVLDGRNEKLTDGVQRALGRQPRDFSTYAQQTAASGAWQT
jgi:uncharacterized protein YbjT (DUF2867 family)